MKLTFLGVSSALSDGYNSNILIEDNKTVMLFDCGEDIKHSLKAAGRKVKELDSVYISHSHSDHSYGLSWLGYYSYFIIKKKLKLFIHESMVSDLWAMLRPAMEKLQGQDEMMTLSNYFDVCAINGKDDEEHSPHFFFTDWRFNLIEQLHVETSNGNMYSYGLVGVDRKNKMRVFISSDSKAISMPATRIWDIAEYKYDYVFCDCDVMNLSGVHPNYNDLKKFDIDTKSRMWLYHYTDLGDKMPDAVADGFAGFVEQGQVFEI